MSHDFKPGDIIQPIPYWKVPGKAKVLRKNHFGGVLVEDVNNGHRFDIVQPQHWTLSK